MRKNLEIRDNPKNLIAVQDPPRVAIGYTKIHFRLSYKRDPNMWTASAIDLMHAKVWYIDFNMQNPGKILQYPKSADKLVGSFHRVCECECMWMCVYDYLEWR